MKNLNETNKNALNSWRPGLSVIRVQRHRYLKVGCTFDADIIPDYHNKPLTVKQHYLKFMFGRLGQDWKLTTFEINNSPWKPFPTALTG